MQELLQYIKEVSLEIIATVLPLPILFESRRKKVLHIFAITQPQYSNPMVSNY